MKIEQAKTIQLSVVLDKIGAKFGKESKNEKWYFSPFREEKEPSFHINISKNIWYDFGEVRGGDVIEFVRFYLGKAGLSCTVSDALRWFENMFPLPMTSTAIAKDIEEHFPLLSIKEKRPLQHSLLIKYLTSRGIALNVAKKYLTELYLFNQDSKNSFFALGFRNMDGGYEIRNQLIKGCVRPKAITFVKASILAPKTVHIYEGFMDYLSVLTRLGTERIASDTIILNSTSCLNKGLAYIKNHPYVRLYSWMDNDDTGEKARTTIDEFVKTQEGLVHHPMNVVYRSHKDVNEWYMQELQLPPLNKLQV